MLTLRYTCMLTMILFTTLKSQLDELIAFNPQNIDFQNETGLKEDQLRPILDFLKEQEKDCSWVKEYPIVTRLINRKGLEVGCEIGVAYGFQSRYFLENTAVKRLYSVDPYRHFDNYDDFMNFPQHYFDVLFYRVKTRLSVFKDRSVLLRKTSVEAAKLFDSNSLDFVYIDADHSYKAVTEDLDAWVPKVRPGGLVAGDDYVVFPTTAQAVRRFTKKHGLKFYVEGNKWWFIKPL